MVHAQRARKSNHPDALRGAGATGGALGKSKRGGNGSEAGSPARSDPNSDDPVKRPKSTLGVRLDAPVPVRAGSPGVSHFNLFGSLMNGETPRPAFASGGACAAAPRARDDGTIGGGARRGPTPAAATPPLSPALASMAAAMAAAGLHSPGLPQGDVPGQAQQAHQAAALTALMQMGPQGMELLQQMAAAQQGASAARSAGAAQARRGAARGRPSPTNANADAKAEPESSEAVEAE